LSIEEKLQAVRERVNTGEVEELYDIDVTIIREVEQYIASLIVKHLSSYSVRDIKVEVMEGSVVAWVKVDVMENVECPRQPAADFLKCLRDYINSYTVENGYEQKLVLRYRWGRVTAVKDIDLDDAGVFFLITAGIDRDRAWLAAIDSPGVVARRIADVIKRVLRV